MIDSSDPLQSRWTLVAASQFTSVAIAYARAQFGYVGFDHSCV